MIYNALNTISYNAYNALILGSINPEGIDLNYQFEYSTDSLFTSSLLTPLKFLRGDSGLITVNEIITSLLAETTYYYRLVINTSLNSNTVFFTTTKVNITIPDYEIDSINLQQNSTKALWRDFNQFDPINKPFLYNAEVVAQSLNNIFRISKYQVFFDNGFGSRLDELIFEPNDFITEDLAFSYIQEATIEFEPRAYIDPSTELIPYYDDHVLDCNVAFGLVDEENPQLYLVDIPNLVRG